jgi:hypothetical protein
LEKIAKDNEHPILIELSRNMKIGWDEVRVFTCCHISQSIGSTNQKKSYCYWPFGNHCILSKFSFMIFKGYVLHPVVCTWNFIAVGVDVLNLLILTSCL